jgi:molybdopterin molybdotransferase
MTTLHEPSWDEARLAAHSTCRALASESIPLSEAIGRVCASNLNALCDLPTYTTSAMDGYALSGAGPWRIVGEVLAGKPSSDDLASGEAVRIATGAVIPLGTETVIEWEKVEIIDGHVHGSPRPYAHIRPMGAECHVGDLLVASGNRLTPGMVGLLSAAGHDEIFVSRKPRVALLLLGDELIQSGIPHNGKVRDSIGPQLIAWLERLGAEVMIKLWIPDELATLVSAIRENLQYDMIITTGGTADGARDQIHPALEKVDAEFVVDRVRSRPGHPTLLAKISDQSGRVIPFLGLPGNPQSAIVGLMTLGAPLISSLLGMKIEDLITVKTRNELSAPAHYNRLILGNLIDGEFEMGEHLGSAMLRGLAYSSGFAVAPGGISPPGTLIRWLPLPA